MQNHKFLAIPSSRVRIRESASAYTDGEIIDALYNIVENIFSDTGLKNKMISLKIDPDHERVLLIKNINNLEQYFVDFDNRFKILQGQDQEMFLIDDAIFEKEKTNFNELVVKYQAMLDYNFYNFKNNFNDQKINIFIPIDEINLREEDRTNFYQYNQYETWNCQVAQLKSNGSDNIPTPSSDESKKLSKESSKLRISRNRYVGRVLGIKF